MNIIEKLGITNYPWEITGAYNHLISGNGNDYKSILFESWEKRFCENQQHQENMKLVATAPEMLEALIEMLIDTEILYNQFWRNEFEKRYSKKLLTVEKATGKTWEEIKELL